MAIFATIQRRLITPIDSVTHWLGVILSWLTLIMALITVILVVIRYFAELNSVGLQELVLYGHAIVFLLVSSYTLKSDEHVRVDILYRRYSKRTKAWINSLGVLLCLFPFCGFLFFISHDFVQASWISREGSSEPGGLPAVFLLKTLIPLAAILLFLQGLAELLRNLAILMNVEEANA